MKSEASVKTRKEEPANTSEGHNSLKFKRTGGLCPDLDSIKVGLGCLELPEEIVSVVKELIYSKELSVSKEYLSQPLLEVP